MAELDFNIDTDPIKRATAELAKLTRASDKSEASADRLEKSYSSVGAAKALRDMSRAASDAATNTTILSKVSQDMYRNSKGQFMSASAVALKYGDDIKRLAAEFNPLLDAQLRLAAAEQRLAQAVSVGVISIREKDAALERLRNQYLGTTQAAAHFIGSSDGSAKSARAFSGSAAAMGKSSNALAYQVQNASYQVGDFFVQIASGTGAMRAAAQQLPQLLGGFGMIGAAAGAVAAIGGALIPMLLSGTIGAKKFEDAISDLSDRLSAYQKWVDYSRASTSVLAAEFGSGAVKARQLADTMQVIAKVQFATQQREATLALKKNFQDLTFAVQDYHAATLLPDGLQEKMAVLEESARTLADSFGLAPQEAERLNATLNTLVRSKSPEQIYQASKSIADQIARAVDNGAKLPPEMLAAAEDAGKLAIQALSASNALDKAAGTATAATSATSAWESAMAGVRGEVAAISQILAGISGIQISATSAKIQADLIERTGNIKAASRLGYEYEANAARIEKVNALTAQGVEYYRASALAQDEFTASMKRYDAQARLAEVTAKQQKLDSAADKKPKGGGGSAKAADRRAAAEVKAAEKGFQNIRELMEKESIFQFAEYEKRQKQLDAAIGKRLLSEQNYQLMSQQLRVLYFGADYEKNALQYQMDLDQLKQHHANKLLSDQEYYRARKDLFWSNLLNEDNRSAQATDLSNTAQYFGQLHSLTGASYDGLQRLQQSFQAASALMNAYTGASQALADPTLSYWQKFLAAGKVLAAGMGFVSAIKGGGKSGGSKPSTSSPSTSAGASGGSVSHDVNLTLVGDTYDKKTVVQMVEELNKAFSDGSKINVRAV